MSQMSEADKLQIDRILSAIADEGASQERMQRLEALLRDRPDLQAYYARVMAMHTVLAYEFSLSDQPFGPVLGPHGPAGGPESRAAAQACENLSTRIQRDLRAGVVRRAQRWGLALALGCAACLAIAFAGYSLWHSSGGRAATAAVRKERLWSPSRPVAKHDGGVVVRDQRSLELLGKLTRDPSITSLLLPKANDHGAPGFTLCSGAAWIERPPSVRERGYLVALPASCMMNVYLDTDANGQNALAVAELDRVGLTTGRTLQFNNLADGGETLPPTARRTGAIGKFTEFNDSSSPMYYILAGSHMLLGGAGEELWYQSDYRVQLDSENLLVIGWDDSGYSGRVKPDLGKALPDRDYNDMRAILWFSFPGEERTIAESAPTYSPPPLSPAPVAAARGSGYLIDVKPGEELVLAVSGYARLQNSFQVVETETGRVLWRHDGSPPGAEVEQAKDRGVYVIRNYSSAPRQYELQGRYRNADASKDSPWRTSPYKVLANDEGSVTVGFEDSVDVPARVDWKDIRVYARWLSD